MKKLFTTTRYKRRNKRRIIKSLEIRKNRKNILYIRNRLLSRHEDGYLESLKNRFPGYQIVIPPEEFSFIKNTEGVVEFINELMSCFAKKQKVFVMLHRVKTLTHDAIVVLLSIMVKFKEAGIDFNGDKPMNRKINELLTKSRFFKQLYRRNFKTEKSYEFTNRDDLICTHGEKNVSPELSAKLIKSAAQYLSNRKYVKAQGVQRIMLEMMQNTNNHASHRQGEKHWWLSVNKNKTKKTVHFSFVDFGIGVLTSLDNKPDSHSFKQKYHKIKTIFGGDNQDKHLERIFSGDLYSESVTGQTFRGKGLPGVGEVVRRHQVSNFFIVTNKVKGNVSLNTYEKLHCNFSGTFYYWELKMEDLVNYGNTDF